MALVEAIFHLRKRNNWKEWSRDQGAECRLEEFLPVLPKFLEYTFPRVRGEYTRQLPAHAMRCLIFKFSATPVPSQISRDRPGVEKSGATQTARRTWANLLIVSPFTTQAPF